jgi:hypothetical protein
MSFIRRGSNTECLAQEKSQSFDEWPCKFVDDSLQKWVKELALQENVFLDDVYSFY